MNAEASVAPAPVCNAARACLVLLCTSAALCWQVLFAHLVSPSLCVPRTVGTRWPFAEW